MRGFIGSTVSVAVLLFPVNVSLAANSFGLSKVDYFHDASLNNALAQEDQKPLDWREPIIGQDGKMTYYTPPAPLLTLLENPNEENAKAYLDWQAQKDDSILKAQVMIYNYLKREKK